MKRSSLLLQLLLLGALPALSCRQIAGIQDLPKPCADPLMIDDMEDGDTSICKSNGRHGGWYASGDGTSSDRSLTVEAIADGARGASHKAVHFTGSGFTDWGAFMAFDVNTDGVHRDTYDASNTGGIRFWMKSNVPVWVGFETPDTVLAENGGDCVDTETVKNCNSNFRFLITAPTNEWTQYEVPYTALRQTGSATWKPKEIFGGQFVVEANASFDVWIDDVEFYWCTNPECRPTCTDPMAPVACPMRGTHQAGCFPADTTCTAIDTWCADLALIDDLEDGDGMICNSEGRNGYWWTNSDGTSKDLTPPQGQNFAPTPIPGGRGASHRAARFAGSGFTDWGAQLALDLNNGHPYDASAAGGVRFWMKANTPDVYFGISTPDTIPVARGGSCAADCDRLFNFPIHVASNDWVQYTVPFDALNQFLLYDAKGNAIQHTVMDRSRFVSVTFTVPQGAPPFEVWVDDVELVSCSGASCVPTCTDPAFPIACPAPPDGRAACWPAGTQCPTTPVVTLVDIVVMGRDDAWALAPIGFDPIGTILHWDGVAWKPSSTDLPPLWDIWANGAGDVWAVGDHGSVVRWDGVAWARTNAGNDLSLDAVWGSGPSDIWAIGYPAVFLHGDGASWSTKADAGMSVLWSLWGSSSNDAWAVGEGGVIHHWDGAAWTATPGPTDKVLQRVWGTGPSDVWAVGDAGTILHFDGGAWTAHPGVTTVTLIGVWGSSPSDVWAVGQSGTILHWNGTLWSSFPSGVTAQLNQVGGSGPDDVWIVGITNTILHFDGSGWKPVAISW